MKKGVKLFLIILIILLLTACSSSYKIIEVEKNTAPETGIVPSTTNITPDEPVANPEIQPLPETTLETKTTSFALKNTKYTTSGAYNGILYSTIDNWKNATINTNQAFSDMEDNGVNYALIQFAIIEAPTRENLVKTKDLGFILSIIQEHPQRVNVIFNPAMNATDEKAILSTTLTDEFTKKLSTSRSIAQNNIIKGFGEFPLNTWGLQATNDRLTGIYNLANANKLAISLHPLKGKVPLDDFTSLAKDYPQITFIVQDVTPIEFDDNYDSFISLLNKTNNVYYTIDSNAILYDGAQSSITKEDSIDTAKAVTNFNAEFDSNYQSYINDAVLRYKPLVNAYPNRVLWGSSLGNNYTYTPEVYNRIIKADRIFIGKMDADKQEALAYKNALNLFGEGVVLQNEISIA
ncbi:hypothetical protein HZA98_04725 [Candidatus Woesearchaeota archaeon]|nr:hypothetical protein [Candidatus Woesearchaeota archaeon]